jgi:hypothetical protein
MIKIFKDLNAVVYNTTFKTAIFNKTQLIKRPDYSILINPKSLTYVFKLDKIIRK